jgi:hypothetical protein
MSTNERRRRPLRRGMGRGRAPIRRDGEGAPAKKREDRDENWLKKFKEGELDDLFDGEEDEETLATEVEDEEEDEERR